LGWFSDIKDRLTFRNWGGRFSGRYRDRSSFYAETYQWLSDMPELSTSGKDPYYRAENQYLSKHDQFRLELYKFNSALYKGDHYNAFRYAQYLYRSGMIADDVRLGQLFGQGGLDILFVAMNLFSLTTDTFADLMVEALKDVQSPDEKTQAAINRIFKNSNFRKLLHLSTVTGSYKGDIIWSLGWSAADKRVWIRSRRADTWLPTVDPMDRMNFSEQAFAHQFKLDKTTYVARERYSENKILLDVQELDSKTGNFFKGEAPEGIFRAAFGADAQREYELPEALPAVIHTPNKMGDDADPYGDSDYGRGVLTLADELNHRLTQLGHQLDKHGDLGMSGPYLEGEETENPDGDNRTNRGTGGKYIERDKEDPEPKYIEMPVGHFQYIKEEIEFLTEEIVRQMRMSPRLLGYKAGAAEEAFDTLRLACVNTLLRNTSRIVYLNESIERIFRSALSVEKMIGHPEAIEDPEGVEVSVSWGDGFPMDAEKRARIWQIRTGQRQTATVMQAVQDMDGIDGAKETVAAIFAENEQERAELIGTGQAARERRLQRGLNPDLDGAEKAATPPRKEPEINAGQEQAGQQVQSR